MTAGELAIKCTPNNSEDGSGIVENFYCLGVLNGMNDMLPFLKDADPKKFSICMPTTGLANEDIEKIFLNWLRKNPNDLKETARVVYILALRERYPCK